VIGALRHESTLLSPQATPDAGGGRARIYLPDATVWAEVERLPAAADIAGDRTRRLARIAAVVRRRTGLALGMRVRFQNADYEVLSIESDEARGRLTLICEERAP